MTEKNIPLGEHTQKGASLKSQYIDLPKKVKYFLSPSQKL